MYLPVYGPTSSIGCLIVRRLLGDDMIFFYLRNIVVLWLNVQTNRVGFRRKG